MQTPPTIAARPLLSHVYIRQDGTEEVHAIIDDHFLAGLVFTLTVIMPFKRYGHEDLCKPARLAYETIFHQLGHFRNLRRIEIEHSKHVRVAVPRPCCA